VLCVQRAQRDDFYAGRALMAFRKGEESVSAQVGGLLIAEFLRLFRTLVHALFNLGKR
jgi:hypothetical protein